ncbi:MAG: carbamate kinase [Thermoflexales bacterium]|nr:carbamate kinase [Thermoflexales bacterium]
MLIVVALGGNALLQRGEPLTAAVQQQNARRAAHALALLAERHQLVITHGNGPQIGLLALQQAASPETPQFPLDVLGAQTQGQIGYMLEQALREALLPHRYLATLLTTVEVDADDPSFHTPTKFIGPRYTAQEAQALAAQHGWVFREDGAHWRRVVPSPQPKRIVQLEVIQKLVAQGVIVICAGGGGVPVVRCGTALVGVEAVIDKDLATSLLARALGAELLVIATEADGVYLHYGKPNQTRLTRVTPAELRAHLTHFPDGSMGPKVRAAIEFVEHTGRPAVIGALHELARAVRGEAGTWVVPAA